ncbi:MAG TPA: metalloregulator ArsR/SmtB family transcription factor [Methanocella sp.]|uniref:ArsR/SmtB family transcription factor n=1 Tax=Methanocella sp. TaxID=2052833 RepID=UPI002B66327F|nr:metalloregulator ArsR/SmtB family transcription factor [Methanocella sp.]HTY91849.1 metalloregulator ArsR/SmtB family transcription factor [Methanocella sp.]
MDEKIKLLKAMGDETRIKILQYLLNGEKCACTIVPFIGKAQPTVSQHLKILVEAGILDVRRDGIRMLYKIKSDQAVRIMEVLDIPRMEVDDALLGECK